MAILPPAGAIVKRCSKCGGAKWKLASAKPITFVCCNKCQGRGGRMARNPAKGWASGAGLPHAIEIDSFQRKD